MTKSEWRHRLKQQRAALSPPELAILSERICQNLRQSSTLATAPCVLGYLAFGSEIRLDPLFHSYPDLLWGMPRCLPHRGLAWHRYQVGDPLLPNSWGFPEPLPTAPEVDPSLATVILIPTLGCDRLGTRLGYGQGFYDRWLTEHPVSGQRWAVVPEQGLVEVLPRDPWDVPMQRIVTESQIVRI